MTLCERAISDVDGEQAFSRRGSHTASPQRCLKATDMVLSPQSFARTLPRCTYYSSKHLLHPLMLSRSLPLSYSDRCLLISDASSFASHLSRSLPLSCSDRSLGRGRGVDAPARRDNGRI
eukprot:1271169-Rhodomonas_salina.2